MIAYMKDAKSKALKKMADPQEQEDRLAAASLKRYRTKMKGARMSRSILG